MRTLTFLIVVAYHLDIHEYMCQILLCVQKSSHMSMIFWKFYLTFDIHEDHFFLWNSPCSSWSSFLMRAFDLYFRYVLQPWFGNISGKEHPLNNQTSSRDCIMKTMKTSQEQKKKKGTDVKQPVETMGIMWYSIYYISIEKSVKESAFWSALCDTVYKHLKIC